LAKILVNRFGWHRIRKGAIAQGATAKPIAGVKD
jgi:hypothetical protein